MQSFDFKKFLPHLYIILGFLVIAYLYNYPVLQGKELSQSDNVSWKAMAHEGMQWHEKTGENVLWSNSMFGGMPTFTFYVPKSNDYFMKVQDTLNLLGKPVNFLFIALLSFYILLCTLRVDRLLAAVGAFAFAFSSYNIIIIGAGHESQMVTIAYLPLVISAFLVLYRGRHLLGGIYLAIAWGLFIVASHLQIIYYSLFIILFMLIGLFVKAIREQKLKTFFISSAVALGALAIGTGPGMSNLMTVREYSEYTMRGGKSELTLNHDKSKTTGGLDKDYAFQWSSDIWESLTVMIPHLYGGSDREPMSEAPKIAEMVNNPDASAPLYWGPQPFLAGPVYFGAIICFLFVLGLMVVRSPHKWWIVAASLLGFILSWGKHLPSVNYFLFDHLPFYNKFRTPSMALAIPEFLFPLLGIWAVRDIMKGDMSKEEIWKKIKIAVGITAGLCLLLALFGSMFLDYTGPGDAQFAQQPDVLKALKDDRSSLAMFSCFRSAALILLAAGLLWAFIKDKIKGKMLIGGLALLIAFDMLTIDSKYLNGTNFEDPSDYSAAFDPRPVDKQIMQDSDPYYRVLDLSRNTYNDAIQCYFHKCIGGYSPAKLELYQDLIDVQLNRQTGFNSQVLNMLNTKYIIIPAGKQGETQIAEKNPDACGNAWFVSKIKWAKNADEEMLGLNAARLGDTTHVPDAFEPKQEAVINDKYKGELGSYTFGKDSSANIKLTKYGLDDLYFQSSNSQPGLAVFSDIYYDKGWEAYVDGKQTPIIKADYLLRAIQIPAGNHKIEFHFRPKTYQKGETIALVSSLLLYALAIIGIVIVLRKNDEEVKA